MITTKLTPEQFKELTERVENQIDSIVNSAESNEGFDQFKGLGKSFATICSQITFIVLQEIEKITDEQK